MRKRILEGWKPEAELWPVRLATLLLLGIGSVVLAIACFRVLGELSASRTALLWVGLCVSPPIGIGLWILGEQKRGGLGAASRESEQPADNRQVAGGAASEQTAETCLKINRDVA